MTNSYISAKKSVKEFQETSDSQVVKEKEYVDRGYSTLYLKEYKAQEHEFIVDRAKELIEQAEKISEYMQTIVVVDLVDRLSVTDPEKWMALVQETRAMFQENTKTLISDVKQMMNRVQYSGPIDRDTAFTELNELLPALEARIMHYQPLLEMHMLKNHSDFEVSKIGRLQ